MFYLPIEAGFRAVVRLLGLLRRERGQTLAEYGLILTLIAVGVMVPTTIILRNTLAGAFDAASTCLNGSC